MNKKEIINNVDILKTNNTKKDIVNDNKKDINNKYEITQNINFKNNRLSNLRKLSIKSDENYKMNLNNNAQEYIEEKLKFIKSKMSHAN